MKYIAIIDANEFKDFKFFEDAEGKYLAVKDANSKSNEWLPLHFEVLDNSYNDYDVVTHPDGDMMKDRSKDAISREYLLSKVKSRSTEDGTEGYVDLEDIENAPSVNRPYKTSRWIDNHNGTFKCEQCGTINSWSLFCPNCGRLMWEVKPETNHYYESLNMPQEFIDAVKVVMRYCQNEDCDLDCQVCPYPLAEIRCGDVIHRCENCKHYGADLHGANCRFCQDMELWEVKENG